jgi:hypothetical protein
MIQDEKGFANFATDSDYNHLASHVNADYSTTTAVTY